MPRPRSLSARLIISSALVSIVLLALTGAILAGLFTAALERSFDQRLRSVLDGLLASLEVTAEGAPKLASPLSDPRFGLPLSGWYWQVRLAEGEGNGRDIASGSLLEQRLAIPAGADSTREPDGVAAFYLTDSNGVRLRAIEQEVMFRGSERRFSILVAGNFDELKDQVTSFNRALAASLVLLGVGLLLAIFVQVRFGLRPLRALQENLAAIRQGRAEQLKGDFPREIEPVAEELNLLIQSNAEIVERARTQVGNLAHALKTPLSVLTNEAAGQDSPLAMKLREQTELMRDQVSLYLDRARRAARAQGLGAVTEVKPVLDALARTLERINRDKALALTVECPPGLRFRGERQDLEEMAGNLMDNACKWARGRVRVGAALSAEATAGGRHWLRLVVEDDGPGLPADKRQEAMKRGRRLDETKPGSGLGLSIVAETAAMYNGSVTLEDAGIGGLRAVLTLPAAL